MLVRSDAPGWLVSEQGRGGPVAHRGDKVMPVRVTPRIVVALVTVGCAPATPSQAEPTLPLQPCRLAGAEHEAKCFSLERAVSPDHPDGPTLTIRGAVLPAREAARRAPVYFFAGGPGQAAMEAFGPLLPALAELGRERDLVFVDQRGTGSSASLDCPSSAARGLAERLAEVDSRAEIEACLATLTHDPRNFITRIAADDVDAVRAGLGHERIALVGGSYGARAAMVYARQHSDRVDRIVLDGVAPVDMAMPVSFARDADDALARMFADCSADSSCAAAFAGGRAGFDAYLTRLRGTPMTYTMPDPRTGAAAPLTVDADMIATAVRAVLYSSDLSALLPYVLARAEAGDPGPLLTQAFVLSDAVGDAMSEGMFLAVVCAEDVPQLTDERIEREAANTFLGPRIARAFVDACAPWPKAELAADELAPIAITAPTLVLSGELDPVTPPRWGDHVMPGLADGRHVIVPGAGHGTLLVGCVRSLVRDFLNGDEPDPACVSDNRRPPFFVDFAGPPA